MQRRDVIWILGAFCTLPSFGIKAIVGLIPIHLHLQKLSSKVQLRAHSLPHNHILRLLLESRSPLTNAPHQLLFNTLTSNQNLTIKDLIVDMDNRFNEVFPSFDLFNKEFTPGSYTINTFPSHFLFHSFNKKSEKNFKTLIHHLNNISIISSLDPFVIT